MRVSSLALAGLMAASSFTLLPANSFAQRTGRAGASPAAPVSSEFELTPYAGYMVFGNFLSGPLGSSVTNKPAPVFGVQFGMRVSPNLSMIGNLAGANSDIQIGVPYLGGVSVAQSSVLLYDAGLQLDMPITNAYGTTFSPFVQAGVGGTHYDISQSFVSTTATNLTGNVGAGADLSVGRGLGIRLMAKDYFGKFNFQDATTFAVDGGVTQNFAFSAGMRFSF
ncbi:MAG: hypothetical protein JWM95_1837 [Gemmatimonadetes bacterium]|nr:hypothetical protein [Gemmatimonadota bacterium]